MNIKKYIRLNQFRINILSGSLVNGLNALLLLISYPIYINYLGFELYSVWALLSIVVSFAHMGELGIKEAIITYVAKAKAEGNISDVKKIVINAFYIICIPSIIIILLLRFSNRRIIALLNIPSEYAEHAAITIQFVGIAIVFYLLFDILSSTIAGYGRLDITNALLLATSIIKILVSLYFLANGYSLLSLSYGMLFAYSITTICSLLLILLYFRLNLTLYKPDITIIGKLINFGLVIIGIQLVNITSFPFVKIILSNTVGIEAVGIFELASKVGYAIRAFFQKGLFAIMPEISFISKSKNSIEEVRITVFDKIKNITLKLAYYAIPFFVIISITSYLWISLWLGDNFRIEIVYSYLLLQPGIIMGLIALPSYYALMATGNQKICFYEALIRAFLTCSLFLVFYLYNLPLLISFVFFSLSVVLSNFYVLCIFRRGFCFGVKPICP